MLTRSRSANNKCTGIQKTPLSGSLLTKYISTTFNSANPAIEVRPQYAVKDRVQVAPNTPARSTLRDDRIAGATESFTKYTQDQVLHSFKESVLQVFETPYDNK
jgi:actin-related protein 4